MKKTFDQKTKQISYLNNDFNQWKSTLIEYAKSYFPNTYKDFSDASVGSMFIEQAAYVGDVCSYYTDTRFQESILTLSNERKNIVNHAISRGYKLKATTPSQTTLEVFMLIPSVTDSDGNVVPDYRYAQTIREGMSATTSDGISFLSTSPVDFTVNTQSDPMDVSVFQRNSSGIPQNYLLRKTVPAISAEIVSDSFSVGQSTPFYKIELKEKNIIEIQSIVDSDNNRWYEVDYLAQDLIPISVKNDKTTDQFLSEYENEVPYTLKFLRTSNRFTKNVLSDGTTYVEFGTGDDNLEDEEIIPNINNVGKGLVFRSETGVSYDPANFMKTKGFGKSPSNTILTVTYLIGGGIESNVGANTVINLGKIEFTSDILELDSDERIITENVRNSVRVNNTTPAVGGSDQETDDQIRLNTISQISSQNRAVTAEDYIIRTYSMPKKFGSIAKVHVEKGDYINSNGSINLYVLSYDSNKNLTNSNRAIVNNLSSYLSQYRMLTDSVNILDGFIINIGIDFKVFVQRGYSKKEVILKCIDEIKDFVDIEKMGFNSPLNLNKLNLRIASVDGVESVAELKIKNLNLSDGNYSKYSYDVENSIKNNILYPSLDPSVFEVKYPSKDIKGSAI